MKKVSQYLATTALAVGLVTAGVQSGYAAKHSPDVMGHDTSPILQKNLTPQLSNFASEELDENTQQNNGVKVAGRTGRYIALGVGAAILGSALTAHHYNRGYYRNNYYYSRPRRVYYRGAYYAPNWVKRKCARRFKSFDWYSGTYVTYSGRVRLCPYLR